MTTPGSLKSAPRQARSQQTLDRLLRATEQLLEKSRFEDISIQQILRRSRVSVGSFYARFHSKDDLLPLLYASYSEDLALRMSAWLTPERWAGMTLAERIRECLELAVANYRGRRGLLRAVALLARSQPRQVTASALRERVDQYDAAARLLLQRRGEIRHPDPELAVQTGLLFTLAACRDKILFAEAPHPSSVNLSDSRLALEMSRAFHAYLTHPPSF